MDMNGKVAFGVEGFDTLLHGGGVRGNCYLVIGAPGTGKTIFGLQFLWAGAALFDEPGVMVTFEQFPDQLYRDALAFGWDLKELEAADSLRVLFTSAEVFADDRGARVLRRVCDEVGAKRVHIDSLTNLASVAGSPGEARRLIYRFVNMVKSCGVTATMATELDAGGTGTAAEHLVDGLIRMKYEPWLTRGRRRTVEVIKNRGRPHMPGEHSFEITSKGLVVYPRLPPTQPAERIGGDERAGTGVAGLDEMTGGGLPRGTCCVVSGSTGLGKTLLGLQFLAEGASRGEMGLFVSLEERPEEIARFARGVGVDVDGMVEKGLLRFVYRVPAELDFDELSSAVRREIDAGPVRRMVFDSVSTLSIRIPEDHQFRNLLYLLMDYTKGRGITSILTDETFELFLEQKVTTRGISSVVDTVVLMRYLEVNSRMHRVLTVLKSRGIGHSKDIVPYTITSKGITVSRRVGELSGVLQGTATRSGIAERLLSKMRL